MKFINSQANAGPGTSSTTSSELRLCAEHICVDTSCTEIFNRCRSCKNMVSSSSPASSVREPQSGKSFPRSRRIGDEDYVLVGVGIRLKKVAFMEVQVCSDHDEPL